MIRSARVPGSRLGGAMFGAYRPPQAAPPSRWSMLQGRMGTGAAMLPPGVRVPMQGDTRPPPAPTPAPSPVVNPAVQGPLATAMRAAPGLPAPSPLAGSAAPGMGVPPGMPPPDANAQARPTGGPLLAALLQRGNAVPR